jgi:hypothetical protein
MHLERLSMQPPPAAGRVRDVTGWDLYTPAVEEPVGRVRDLLLDREGTPRYLEIVAGDGAPRLLPIGLARAVPGRRALTVPGLPGDGLERLPTLPGDAARISATEERRLVAALDELLAPARRRTRPVTGTGIYGPTEVETAVRVEPRGPRLALLSRLREYVIPDDEPDPRGWDVCIAGRRCIGQVEDVLIDTQLRKVRHLVCVPDGEAFRQPPAEHRFLVPVGLVRLDPDEGAVLVDTIDDDAVPYLPTFHRTALQAGEEPAPDEEDRIMDRFGAAPRPETLYADPRFDPGTLFQHPAE